MEKRAIIIKSDIESFPVDRDGTPARGDTSGVMGLAYVSSSMKRLSGYLEMAKVLSDERYSGLYHYKSTLTSGWAWRKEWVTVLKARK